ncbi:gluconate 2-dehydrogenase subunit 3 family protein [Devosia sp. A16]|uniref:gluconate 2-dehydrogenase subunit 3 family protein n=1 Tax=Devosia sp. A16 TaxID=1736675 RepID=UPI0006D83184|nr:gluconate 2-dehydrogenase subunit 3 family protein [Devosia sp. A16]
MDRALLAAVVDRIMPADQDGGAIALGALDYLDGILAARPKLGAAIAAGLVGLPPGFVGLADVDKDAALAAVDGAAWFRELCELVAEGVYADPGNGGNRSAASWRMVGYEHGLPEGPTGPAARHGRPPQAFSGTLDYDVIIVGAGAGGGVAAGVLAEAGKHVLLLERGLQRDYADSGYRDHLRNHRLALYGHNTGPDLDGNPRVLVGADGVEQVLHPHENGYQNLASAVGSGTLVYGAQAWRFHRADFKMASLYGVPQGSSLVDWPIGYDDLAPWYERAEWEIGVAGDGAAHSHEGLRARDYPMRRYRTARRAPSSSAVPMRSASRRRDRRSPSTASRGTAATPASAAAAVSAFHARATPRTARRTP